MSTAPVDPSYATNRVEIHHSEIFDGWTPADCGASDSPCPAASDWRYVKCRRCLALMVHARRAANDNALCGAGAGEGRSTTRRSRVQCPECLDEIGRRLRK
jgi:hypothetical protein